MSSGGNPPRVLGILGGMGPLAGAQFFRDFTAAFPADRDQDHPIVHLLSDPLIPDRSSAIIRGTESPARRIREGILQLLAYGADVVAVPCNTAHHFIDAETDLLPGDIRLVHIVDATLDSLREHDQREVWLLATSGTVHSRMYQRRAASRQVSLRLPPPRVQALIDGAIAAIKARDPHGGTGLLAEAHLALARRRDIPFVAACTEIPLIAEAAGLPASHLISSLDALVEHTVRAITGPPTE